MSIFVLDSNFFIEAHRVTYPLDVAHSFWNKVLQLAHEERIISIDKVKDEIWEQKDALKDWCENYLPQGFFKDTTGVIQQYSQVIGWANAQAGHYTAGAIAEFMEAEVADAFLIAFAYADSGEGIIVTHEVSAPQKISKIRIPDVCQPFGVRYCNTVDMFRILGETF